MKIAITGHTAGIGKGIYDSLKQENEFFCFSRYTGHDIVDSSAVEEILEATLQCDVFINNAYAPYVQLELAQKWYEKNKNSKKLIVNIGCYVTTVLTNPSLFPDLMQEFSTYTELPLWNGYFETKQGLEDFTIFVNSQGNAAKSTVICPAVVNTRAIFPSMAKLFDEMITVYQVAEIVQRNIKDWQNGILVSKICIENKNY